MIISGKKVMVLGGAGLVGRATCRFLIQEKVKELTIASLAVQESEDFINELSREMDCSKVTFHAVGGNLFVREEFKNLSRSEILDDPKHRKLFLSDIIGPLSENVLLTSTLYRELVRYKPDILIDCINTATAVAYQDVFTATQDVAAMLTQVEQNQSYDDHFLSSVEKLLGTQYIPQLIRHVQIMLKGLKDSECGMYVKVGTSGTGGMGLNIPYTHSEDKPSRVLLAKSAIGGAHTLLLFLMGRTPDAPIIKEVKPTAAIAWKRIDFGPIYVKGKPVVLEDCNIQNSVPLSGQLVTKIESDKISVLRDEKGQPEILKAPYVDTGENGLFSLGEFEAITDEGQMEFITPEEIAQSIIWEIKGRNTGSDIVNALDNATMGPTYRAGYLRNRVLKKLQKLEKIHGVDSVAFEMLGPPRLSKLLYEIYLLKTVYHTFKQILTTSPEEMSEKLQDLVSSDLKLRSRIISIGIPILLPDGNSMLRGKKIKIPAGVDQIELTEERLNHWAEEGWVDLRITNMQNWKSRIEKIMGQLDSLPDHDTSSRVTRNQDYWFVSEEKDEIHIGKVVSWIFINEEKGARMKF